LKVVQNIVGRLYYGASSYPGTASCNGGTCSISRTIDLPLNTNATQLNSFYWNLALYDGSTSYNLNTTTVTQNVSRIYLEKCAGAYTTQTLNFTAWNEDDYTRIDRFDFKGAFDTWLGSGTVKRNQSYDLTNVTGVTLCISPTNLTYYSDAQIEYSKNSTWVTRDYHFENKSLTNVSEDIRLILLKAASSTSFIIKVQDQYLNPVEDALVYIYRFYPGEGVFRVVQIAKTDQDGKTVGFYEVETVDYKHVITLDGVTKLTTDPQKIVPESIPYTLTFTIGETGVIPWVPYLPDDEIVTGLTFNSTTEVVTFTWIDEQEETTVTSGRLYVFQYSNTTNQTICSSSLGFSSGTLTCNVSGESGTFYAYGYLNNEIVDRIMFVIITAREIMGDEGLLIALFIIMVAGFAFIWNPTAGIIGINLGVIFSNLMGFITVSPVFILGGIAVSIIAIMLLKT